MCQHIKTLLKGLTEMYMKGFSIYIGELKAGKKYITIEGKKIHLDELNEVVVKLIIERGMSGLSDKPFFVKVEKN